MKHYCTLLAAVLMTTVACVPFENNEESRGNSFLSTCFLMNSSASDQPSAASITTFNPFTSELTTNAFSLANGAPLGNNVTDALEFSDKLFIAVSGSGKILNVNKLTLTKNSEIICEKDGETLSPMRLATDGTSIYVSYSEGYVGKLDPAGNTVTSLTKVGDSPEGIAYLREKLYVANSGGNSVSVLNTGTMVEEKSIEVVEHPCEIESDGGQDIYILSLGDGSFKSAKIQRIEVSNNFEISTVPIDNPVKMDADTYNNLLYVVTKDADIPENELYIYDAFTEMTIGTYPANGSYLKNVCGLSADPYTGLVYVCYTEGTEGYALAVSAVDGLVFNGIPVGEAVPVKAVTVYSEQ